MTRLSPPTTSPTVPAAFRSAPLHAVPIQSVLTALDKAVPTEHRLTETSPHLSPLFGAGLLPSFVYEGLQAGRCLPWLPGMRPRCRVELPSPQPSTQELSIAMDRAVRKLQEEVVVVEVPGHFPRMVLPMFPVPKKRGGVRLVLNAKELNRRLQRPPRFSLPTPFNIEAPPMGSPLAVADLKDGFYSLPMHQTARPFVCFRWKGRYFSLQRLVMGLKHSPWLFASTTQAVARIARLYAGGTIEAYLDDVLIAPPPGVSSTDHLNKVRRVFEALGLHFNNAKLKWPNRQVIWLGWRINSATMSVHLPASRRRDIRRSLLQLAARIEEGLSLPLRYVASALGRFISAAPVIPLAHVDAKPLTAIVASHAKRRGWNSRLYVHRTHIGRMHHLVSLLSETVPFEMVPRETEWLLTTDASKLGMGAILTNRLHPDMEARTLQMPWSRLARQLDVPIESSRPSRRTINLLELHAVELALTEWAPLVSGSRIRLRLDSAVALSWLRRRRVGPWRAVPVLRHILRTLTEHDIHYDTEWLASKMNTGADLLSRRTIRPDATGYTLTAEARTQVWTAAGLDQTMAWELFSHDVTHILPQYCAQDSIDPRQHPNALDVSWWDPARETPAEQTLHYAFPPVSLIPRVLTHLRRHGGRLLLVTPEWKHRHWWTTLMSIAGAPTMRVPPADVLCGSALRASSHGPRTSSWCIWNVCVSPQISSSSLPTLASVSPSTSRSNPAPLTRTPVLSDCSSSSC